MYGLALLPIVAALGLRHGVDPDHLAALDGLSRFHPSRWNGVFFAIGHGTLVTLLAVGFGGVLSKFLAPYSIWILLGLGVANLWRLIRPATKNSHRRYVPRFAYASPLLLGVLFGMGFETASQLSALLLAGRLNSWLLGIVFSLGMMIVDGTDGFLAARVQQAARLGSLRAVHSSRVLSLVVAVFSFVLVAIEILGYGIDRAALPLGIGLFCVLISLRLWSASIPQTQTVECRN